MTVKRFAIEHDLWSKISSAIQQYLSAADADNLLQKIADLPIRPSHAVRSLGAYVSRSGQPIAIRLQFGQEHGNLRDTFLHELAHLCDHLCHQSGKRYRRAHGSEWQRWAAVLGTSTERCGKSEALQALYLQRSKLVAVCQSCGAELHRTRRLNRRQKYFHRTCGGQLRPV